MHSARQEKSTYGFLGFCLLYVRRDLCHRFGLVRKKASEHATQNSNKIKERVSLLKFRATRNQEINR